MGHGLTSAQQEGLIKLIISYVEVFEKRRRIGLVKGYKATVNTGDKSLPHAQHPCPAGLQKQSLIEETINQLLAWDVIEPSKSNTASLVVLVWQNNK